MIKLREYLRNESGYPYSLGSADCVTLAAGWVADRRGLATLALVPLYASEVEAVELTAGWGGLARAMGRVMRCYGLAMTRNPQPGDVAFVALRNGVAAAAIRTARGWAIRFEAGLARLPFNTVRVVAAWSV